MKKKEKRKHGFAATLDKISELPQVLLQHIQYHLSPKQAAQTVTLSKAWLNTWSNRPNINLSEFSFEGTKDEFNSLLNSTLQGYHDHKLCIKDFRLRLSKPDSESLSLLEKWIPILINMGIKEFQVNAESYFDLPRAVFEAESLVVLSLEHCWLDKIRVYEKVMFKHLKVLKLSEVYIAEITFQRIISSCPLIEDMQLKQCEGLRSIKVNNLQNLKEFYFMQYDCSSFWYPLIDMQGVVTNLKSITICFRVHWFYVHNFKDFPNLKYLSLTRVFLSEIFFYNFSSYFPSLENLILDDCYGFEEFQISSHSIQHFRMLDMDRSNKAGFDTPNIRSFKFSGNILPTLSFAKNYSKWKSDIDLNLDDASLWSKVNGMLKELSQSEISLNIFELPNYQQNNNIVHFEPVEVDNVILHTLKQSCGVNGFFCVCRPKNIDVCWYINEVDEWEREGYEFAEYVCKILMERESEDFIEFWQKDLKEVRMNMFDDTLYEWRPLHGTSLRECALPNNKYRQQIRFQLKWTEAKCTIAG